MLLIGNNELALNEASLCAIVQKHLNDSISYGYKETKEVQVSAVKHSDHTFTFTVTMVEKKPAA